MSSETHEHALRRAQGGDTDAFRALYLRFAPAVHGALLARVSTHDADDLMQEVFLTAWQRLGDVRRSESFGAWLVTIARHRAGRLAGRARTEQELPEGLPAQATEKAAGDEILEIVRGLPETYREALTMRLVEGMSGPEIAAATGLTPGSVRVHLCRGTKLLRERLQRKGIA